MLLDYLDGLNQLYAEVGNQDIRFTGLHNTYSPAPIVVTTRRTPKPGEELKDIPPQLVIMGDPVNSWPLPEMRVSPDAKVAF